VLGDGTQVGSATPVDVTGLTSGVTAVAAGKNHSCALMGDGGVTCWGDNGEGQLGDGTTTVRLAPVRVIGLPSRVSAIAAAGDRTRAIRLTPVSVAGLAGPGISIATGEAHTCAVTTAGAVECWGSNSDGQLGTGVAKGIGSPTPAIVPGL